MWPAAALAWFALVVSVATLAVNTWVYYRTRAGIVRCREAKTSCDDALQHCLDAVTRCSAPRNGR